jgi:Tfp pilus assembly protein PilN
VNTNLNLSSLPFRNRKLPWAITVVVTLISVLCLAWIISSSFQVNSQYAAVQKDVEKLQREKEEVKKRTAAIKAILTPAQKQALVAAHALYDRKHFPWSRLLADLEAELPGYIRVTHINVRNVEIKGGQTVADLELAVASKRPDDVTEMIALMEREGIFHAELLAQTQEKGRGENDTESTLSLHYVPRNRASSDTERNDSVAEAVKTGSG